MVREAGCASSSAVALLRQQRKTVNKRPIPPGFRVRPPDLALSESPLPSFLLRFRLLLVEALSLIAAAAVLAVGDGSDIFVDEERAGRVAAAPLWAIAEVVEATSVEATSVVEAMSVVEATSVIEARSVATVEADGGGFDGFGEKSSAEMALGAMEGWMEEKGAGVFGAEGRGFESGWTGGL